MSKTLIVMIAAACSVTAASAQAPRFERDILPIFTANCFNCHSGGSLVGLDLRTAASTLRGSYQGPVVVKGSPEKSLLYQKVSSRVMPPPQFLLKMTDAQIETIKKWIEAGAPSDDAGAGSGPSQAQIAQFEQSALPIFKARCVGCHGEGKPMADLDLRTLPSLLKGSRNGPVVQEGSADKSVLIRNVSSARMPPPGTTERLNDAEIKTLRQWIDTARFGSGAEPVALGDDLPSAEELETVRKGREFWAFRPPLAHAIPELKNKKRVRNQIDAFVGAKLESKGLNFSPDASDLTLMRRAYLDLTGLPPSPEDIETFLADRKPGAYERLIDRLLASPQYGVRWARHWLDSAGYTDTTGQETIFEGIWRYRDYVVDSFNADKPYDRFLIEQIAGDELVDWRSARKYTPEILNSLIATGYLRSTFDRTDADITNLPQERYDVLIDLVDKVSTGVLGLTVGCARCHSHKFDPIPQRDYYRTLAVFASGYNTAAWTQPQKRYLPNVSKPDQEEIDRYNAEIDRPLDEFKKELARLRAGYEERLLDTKLLGLPEAIRVETKAAVQAPAEKRDTIQQFLATKFGKMLAVKPEEVDRALNEGDRKTNADLEAKIKTLTGRRHSYEKIQALWDDGPAPTIRLLKRGMLASPGPKVEPGFLMVASAPEKSAALRPPDTKGETSGHRLAFARWLASRENPLTARVMVNRVWQHHFGKGIVETPDNFGRMGSPPTHPELLDTLAVGFMENGWSVKWLQKQIMTSTTYRQSSRQTEAGNSVDPDNHLLWRMNLRRLESEAIRDSILMASGKLDLTMGGPAVLLEPRPDGLQVISEKDPTPNSKWRRSLYLEARRGYPLSFLEVFDYPLMQTSCNRRLNSSTPLQSLTLLNDDFMIEQSRLVASRLDRLAAAKSLDAKIEMAYLLSLSRKPNPAELSACAQHFREQRQAYLDANLTQEAASEMALASLCQMLLSTNEFLYLD